MIESTAAPDITMYTVKEIRELFNYSQYKGYALMNAKWFPSIRIGGRALVEKTALINWLKENKDKNIVPREELIAINENMNEIIMYTVKDLQKIFKCSHTQVYALVNANGFPSIRIGGKILVEHGELKKWLEQNRGKSVLL